MKQVYFFRFILVFAFAVAVANIQAQVYVKHDAAGANDGSSWQNAYTKLETALANTFSGEIWVAAGTYKPGGTSSVFSISKSIALYGGFAGTESSLSQRNPATNITTLSGDINGDDISENFTANKSDNTQHVIYVDSLLSTAVTIDGFAIIGGHTSDSDAVASYFRSGGGIYALSPINVAQCSFFNNFGRSGGCIFLGGAASGSNISGSSFTKNYSTSQSAGILVNALSDVTVQGCSFRNNKTTRGAFFALYSSNISVSDCEFKFNVNTDGAGGAFYNFNSTNVSLSGTLFEGNVAVNSGALYYDGNELATTDPANFVVSNCIFKTNSTTGGIGGAFRNRNGSYTLEDCMFDSNTATGSGGQIRNDTNGDNVVYKNCSFIKGTSGGWGGAHTCYGLGTYQIEDCLYQENTTTNLGGAMNCGFVAMVTLDGCTFNGNTSLNSAGGAIALQNDSTTVVILNSEFNDNKANSSGGAIFSGASTSSSIVVVDNSQFWTNETLTGVGGAINVAENGDDDIGSLTLSNTLFGFNIAPVQGGAINMSNCDATITSCLFFNNLAGDIGTGGAISNNTSDSNHVEVLIMNSTFADNFGVLAAGIANWTGLNAATSNMTFQNTILRHDGGINYAIEDGTPTVTSNGGNLSDDASMEAYLTHPKDIQLEDAGFVDPDDFDFSLKQGSICIDAGVDAGAPEFDLAGNPRINAVDIGALENQNVVNVRETVLENQGMLSVAPNPVVVRSVKATLLNNWKGELQVRLFDVVGRTVRTMDVEKTGDRLEFELGLEGIKAGVYDLVVSNGTQAVVTRIVRM